MQNLLNTFRNKTVLITGISGFKGSWLAIWLHTLGAKVIGYSLSPKTSKDNFAICGLDKKFRCIKADIRNEKRLFDVFKQYQPQLAYHLAAQSLVLESYKQPAYTYHTNIMGTVNFFEAVRKTPSVKVAINITSDKCYAIKSGKNYYTESDPLGGIDPYSSSKAASEIITYSYLQSFFSKPGTTQIASVRAGNVIGGGDWAENRIIPDCMRALFHNKPIVIRNPNAVRPWQHVLDPLYGYLLLGSYLYTKGTKYEGAWNFGPSAKNIVTVKEIIHELIRQYGKGTMILRKKTDRAHYETKFLHLNNTKACKELGWTPLLNYKKAIQWTLAEYMQHGGKTHVFQQRVRHIEAYCQKIK